MAKTIKRDTFSDLETWLSGDLRDDYSPRGMFVNNCLAVVTDESSWTIRGELQDMLNDLNPDNDADTIEDVSTLLSREPSEDTLGRSRVFYWFGIAVEDEEN